MDHEELTRFVSDGFDRAKRGEAATVYAQTLPYFESGTLPLKSHYPFGWIIYYALHQAPAHAVAERKRMLGQYLRLSLRKPHKLHSMILLEAIRLAKDSTDAVYLAARNRRPGQPAQTPVSFSIVRFAPLWNLANLREGDWRRKEQEGKMMNSTVEKFITAYVNEIEETRAEPSEEFMQVMRKALRDYADSPILMAQTASLLELRGEREKAIEYQRKAVLGAPAKGYLWTELARLVGMENPRLYVGLLSKALSAPGPEEYKGRIRLLLAECLVKNSAFGNALFELELVSRIYKANSWHLPRLHADLKRSIPEGCAAADGSESYRRLERTADQYLYTALPVLHTKKNYHKPASEGPDRFGRTRRKPVAWRVVDETGNQYWLTPSDFDIDESLPAGAGVDIRVFNGRVVYASAVSPTD